MSDRSITATSPDGVRLSVHEWGNADGPPLLFVHGFSQSHRAFLKQAHGELAKDFRIIAFDLRGHGASDKPRDEAAYTDGRRWADDVAAVIQTCRLQRPFLIGWSMGGRVVSQYLDVHGDDRLTGLVFVGSRTVVTPDRSFLGPGAAMLAAMQVSDPRQSAIATEAFLRECFHPPPDPAEFAELLKDNLLTPPWARAGAQRWPGQFDAALSRVIVPTLVVHGTQDRIIQPAAAEYTAQIIAHATLAWIEGAGHMPFIERASEIDARLKAFARTVVD